MAADAPPTARDAAVEFVDAESSPCLLGPRTRPADGVDATYDVVPSNGFLWTEPLVAADRVLVVAGSIFQWNCLAALRTDLTVAWSRRMPGLGRHVHLVALDGGAAIVVVEPDAVQRAWIDVETGALSDWSTSAPPRAVDSEWTTVAPMPGGGFVAIANEGTESLARGYDADGRAVTAAVPIADNARYPIATRVGTRVLVGYHEVRARNEVVGPFIVELDREAQPLPAVAPVGTVVAGSYLRLSSSDPQLYAAWSSPSGISLASLGSDLLPIGEVRVAVGGDSMYLRDLDVARSGSFLLSWEDYRLRESGVLRLGDSPTAVGHWPEADARWLAPVDGAVISLGWVGTDRVASRLPLP